MPESPRWLATHGKEDEAFKVLKKINGNTRETELIAEAVLFDIRVSHNAAEAEKQKLDNLFDFLRKILVCFTDVIFMWWTCIFPHVENTHSAQSTDNWMPAASFPTAVRH